MDDVLDALAAQQQELLDLVRGANEADLGRPTRCEGWSVADVLLHLAQTNEMAIASVGGRLIEAGAELSAAMESGVRLSNDGGVVMDVDDWAEAAVQAERGPSATAVRDRWAESAQDQEAAFREVDLDTRVQWVAGMMAARSLATTRLSEGWIHTVDVASAWDVRPAPTARLWHVARLVWRTVPYAFARAGLDLHAPVAFELDAPDGSTWTFAPPDGKSDEVTVVRGPAEDLCEVAGQRATAAETGLTAQGPDAEAVLGAIRTFA
jgi:uncharacterized protein (TIGR03084 family)